MKAFWALVRREYLEHRGAFLYGPLIVIGILTLVIVLAFVSGHYRFSGAGGGLFFRVFDTGYMAISALWGAYLFVAVFFYFADAFNADRRNNALLFWKSMPQSDLKILWSKFVAGLTVLPLLIFVALLLTGIVAAIATLVAPLALPVLGPPDLPGTALAWVQISALALVYLVLMLLWYAPFFAWVGALSTIAGRWSIPLALAVPVVVSLFEGVIDFGSAPGGSYILSFLRERMSFNFGTADLEAVVFSAGPIDLGRQVSHLVAGVDWLSLAGGLVASTVLIYLASLYRRRSLKS